MKIKILISIITILILSTAISALATVEIQDYYPKPVESGDFFDLWLKVEKTSRTIHGTDSKITIFPRDGLTLSDGEFAEKKLDYFNAYGYEIIKYRLKAGDDAHESMNSIKVVIDFDKDTSVTRYIEFEVEEKDINYADIRIGQIISQPEEIRPDQENVKLNVNLLNIGDATAQNIKTQIIGLIDGISLSDSYSGSSLIGNIREDGNAMVIYYLDIDKNLKPGNYELDLVVEYKFKPEDDEFENAIVTLPLIVAVHPTPIYSIESVKFDPEVLSAGDGSVKMLVTIKNIGQAEGESVRIKAYPKSEQPFTFDISSNYVSPKLEPNETAQVTLEFDIDDDANIQDYFLDIEFKNLVKNDIIVSDDKIKISVKNSKKNISWIFILLGVAALLLFFGYKFYSGKKNKKKRGHIKGNYKVSHVD